jgi:hypothetical protein
MIKPQIFLISTIGFLCLSIMLSLLKPKTDPYPGSVASTTKIAKYKDMESKFIKQFTFNKYFKPWAGKAVYKGGQRVINGVREKDGWYFSMPIKTTSISNGLKALVDLTQALPDLPITLSISPLNDEFPTADILGLKTFTELNEKTMSKFSEQLPTNVKFVMPYAEIKQNWQNYYYKTDHHFTLDGALLVFNAMMQSMNLPLLDKSQLELVPQKFSKGSRTRAYIRQVSEPVVITNNIENIDIDSLDKINDSFMFNTKKTKNVNNTGELTTLLTPAIYRYQNKQALNKQHILIIGNSYSSYHMPMFFSRYFSTIDHSIFYIDNSFFTKYNITNYVKNNHIDHIFIIIGEPVSFTFSKIIKLQQSLAITDSPPLPDAWVNMKE